MVEQRERRLRRADAHRRAEEARPLVAYEAMLGGARPLLTLMLGALGAACTLPFDEIGFSGGTGGANGTGTNTTTATGGTGSSSATGFGGADCTSGEGRCIPPVPPDWSGPVLMAGDAGEHCVSPVAEGGLAPSAQDLAGAYQADPLECACACTPDPSSCEVAFSQAATGCRTGSNNEFSVSSAAPGCASSGHTTSTSWMKVGLDPSAACTEVAIPSGGAVTLVTPRDACPVKSTVEGCSDGNLCVPGGEAEACVFRPGVFDCGSATGYPERRILVAQAPIDERTCDAASCSCGVVVGGCAGQAQFFSDASCNTPLSNAFTLSSTCVSVNAIVGSASYVLAQPSFTCPAAGVSMPMGSVTADPAQATTLCCTSK
jgi:hypothetical protein